MTASTGDGKRASVSGSARSKVRKRAMSMASGMPGRANKGELSPKSKRRSLGPPKGILKPRTNMEDNSLTPSMSSEPVRSAGDENEDRDRNDETVGRSFSSLSRRVSFAPQASVRTFARDNNTNSTEAPSSPAPSDSEINPHRDILKQSHAHRISSRTSFASSDGEESMDLDDSMEVDDKSMDSTELIGDGIVSRRRSSTSKSHLSARASHAQEPTPSVQDAAHPIGKPLKPVRPPSQAFLDLQSLVSENFHSNDESIDMEIEDATRRLSAAQTIFSGVKEVGDDSLDSISQDHGFNQDDTIHIRKTPVINSPRSLPTNKTRFPVPGSGSNGRLAERLDDTVNMSVSDSVFNTSNVTTQLMDASFAMSDITSDDEVDMTLSTFVPRESGIQLPLLDNYAQGDLGGDVFSQLGHSFAPLDAHAADNHELHSDAQTPAGNFPESISIATPSGPAETSDSKIASSDSRLTQQMSTSSAAQTGTVEERVHQPAFRRPSGYSRSRQSFMMSDLTKDTQAAPPLLQVPESFPPPPKAIASGSSPSKAGRVRRSSMMPSLRANASLAPETAYNEQPATPISIEEFFIMTGVKFMDEISCPRKSVVRPSFGTRRDSEQGTQRIYNSSDYFLAMNLAIPQLHIYSWVASELRKRIDDSKDVHRTAVEEVAKITPAQFIAYAEADDEDRQEFTSHLKLVKVCEQMRARATWYRWKRDWISKTRDQATRAKDNLLNDQASCQNAVRHVEMILTSIRKRHECFLKELEEEKSVVSEIESGDQQLLEELKETMSEQKTLLEEYTTKLSESRATKSSLLERLQELQVQQNEATDYIERSRQKIAVHTGNTTSGVVKLKEQLECIQSLSLWNVKEVGSSVLRLVYGTSFNISIVCQKFVPIVNALEVATCPRRQHFREELPGLSDFMASLARSVIVEDASEITTAQSIVVRLSSCWASLSQIHLQLSFLALQCPVLLNFGPLHELEAKVVLVFKKVKAKAFVTFRFSRESLLSWPMTIRQLEFTAEVVYGDVRANSITEAMARRLNESGPADNHACLQDACCAALAVYL